MIDRTQNVTIQAGASLSTTFIIGGDIEGFEVDPNFTGSVLTFQSNPSGAGLKNIYDGAGFEVAEQVTPGAVCPANATKAELAHVSTGKVRSGSAAVPTVQAQTVTIGIIWRDRNSS